jgi:hypothetical protein
MIELAVPLRVGGLPGDRKHVPKVKRTAQPSMCVNVSLRSSSTHGGVGCIGFQRAFGGLRATGFRPQRLSFLLVWRVSVDTRISLTVNVLVT